MDAEQSPDLRSQLAAYVRVPVVVGFMAALTWMATFYSVVPTDAGAATFTGSRATDVYLLSIVVTVGTDGLIWAFSSRVLALARKLGPATAALLMAASTLVLALAHLGGDASAWLAVAATVIAGTSSTTLLLCWALALGGIETRAMFTSLVLAYILSSFMNVFTAVSNDVTNAILSLALPLVSLACLQVCPQTVGPTRFERYAAQDRASGSDLFRAPLRPSPLLWKLSGAFFIWASVNRLFRREYAALVGSDVAVSALVQVVATVAVAVVVLGIVAILTRLPKRFRFESIYRVFFLTMLAGVVLLPVALNGSHAALGSALNTAGYQIFCMFMWSIIAIACHDYPQDALRVFGFTGLFWAGGAAVGVLGTACSPPPSPPTAARSSPPSPCCCSRAATRSCSPSATRPFSPRSSPPSSACRLGRSATGSPRSTSSRPASARCSTCSPAAATRPPSRSGSRCRPPPCRPTACTSTRSCRSTAARSCSTSSRPRRSTGGNRQTPIAAFR